MERHGEELGGMIALVADTHAALWYLQDAPRLSRDATLAMESAVRAGDTIAVSAISLVEIAYLVERRRVAPDAFEVVAQSVHDPATGLVLVDLGLTVADVLRGVPRDLVPDMPDRIISATAVHLGLPLVTADGKIRASGIATIW